MDMQKKIIVSFIDDYKNVRKNITSIGKKELDESDYKILGLPFSKSAKSHGMTVQTYFEEKTLIEYSFTKSECLSHEMAVKLTNKTYKSWKARGRKYAEMVDVYNSCKHFCKYCYANYDEKKVLDNYKIHDDNSSSLIDFSVSTTEPT